MRACVRDLAKGGATEAFVRYNPVRWLGRGASARQQAEVIGQVREHAATMGLRLKLFITLKRDDAPDSWREAVNFAVANQREGVVGVDVSSAYDVADCRSVPVRGAEHGDLREQLCRATDNGLLLALHCGWHEGRRDLEDALALPVARIGHATPLRSAADLDSDVASRGIVVEVCPGAFERRTGERYTSLPLGRWLDSGIKVEVGSDHPIALGTTTRAEHQRMAQAFPAWASQVS